MTEFRDAQEHATFHEGREYERKIQAKRIAELKKAGQFFGREQIFHRCTKGIAPYPRLLCSICRTPVDGTTDFNAYKRIKELEDAFREIITESGKVDITNWPRQQQICQAIAQKALEGE